MKPSDLMLGIRGLFAVLLPGMVATWLLLHYLPAHLTHGALPLGGGGGAGWVAYLVASYTLGHFVFMGGSKLDPICNLWRGYCKAFQKDVPYETASELRRRLTPMLGGDGLTTLKWARSYVGIHSADGRAEIDRLEADSKFFRSMVVMSLPLAGHFLFRQHHLPLTLAMVLLGVLSFWRYCEQRWKMTELTYATAVILHETKCNV